MVDYEGIKSFKVTVNFSKTLNFGAVCYDEPALVPFVLRHEGDVVPEIFRIIFDFVSFERACIDHYIRLPDFFDDVGKTHAG